MIDFSEIEAYYGPYAVEDLDAAIAVVQNADETPDASHTNALISSAGVANAISAAIAAKLPEYSEDVSAGQSVTIALQGSSGARYAVMLISARSLASPAGDALFFAKNYNNSNLNSSVATIVAATNLSISKSGAGITITNGTAVGIRVKVICLDSNIDLSLTVSS